MKEAKNCSMTPQAQPLSAPRGKPFHARNPRTAARLLRLSATSRLHRLFGRTPSVRLNACFKTVASAILADVELGFQPSRKSVADQNALEKQGSWPHVDAFSERQDAALHGRPGGPLLLLKQALRYLPLPANFLAGAVEARICVALGESSVLRGGKFFRALRPAVMAHSTTV